MPRVSILSTNKKQYMIDDLPYWLIKEARKKGFHQKDLAKAIDISPQAFSRRIKKRTGKYRIRFVTVNYYRYSSFWILPMRTSKNY